MTQSSLDASRLHLVHALVDVCELEGGIVRFLLDFLPDLTARGHRVTLLTEHAPSAPPAWLRGEPGLPHVRVISPSRWGWLGAPSWLIPHDESDRELEEIVKSADIIHLHKIWESFTLRVNHVAKRCGKPDRYQHAWHAQR